MLIVAHCPVYILYTMYTLYMYNNVCTTKQQKIQCTQCTYTHTCMRVKTATVQGNTIYYTLLIHCSQKTIFMISVNYVLTSINFMLLPKINGLAFQAFNNAYVYVLVNYQVDPEHFQFLCETSELRCTCMKDAKLVTVTAVCTLIMLR